jgi:hypothetical protein
MTRYTFNGAGFFTVRISELKAEQRRRSWALTLAPLRRLLARLNLPNSAVQALAATAVLPVLTQTFV